MVRKLKQYLVQEKRGFSSQKKATTKGKKSAMRIPTHPALVDQRRRSCSESEVIVKRVEQELKEQQKQSSDRATFRNRSQTISCSSYFEDDATTMKDRVLTENAKDLNPEQCSPWKRTSSNPWISTKSYLTKWSLETTLRPTKELVHVNDYVSYYRIKAFDFALR